MEDSINMIPYEVTQIVDTVEHIADSKYVAYPVSNLSSLGAAGNGLFSLYQACIKPGGEGIYKVTFPKGVSGTLHKFKNENAYLGSINGADGLAQARLTQLPFNPEQMMLAFTLIGIDCKLDTIIETQARILEYMHDVQKSKIAGAIALLNDDVCQYKYNWQNEGYRQQKLNSVGAAKRDAYAAIDLNKKQIEQMFNEPSSLHWISDANRKINELNGWLEAIYEAYYLLEYATFFECVLLQNYEMGHLDSVIAKIDEVKHEYNELYVRCRAWISKMSGSSIGSVVAQPLRKLDQAFGKIFGKLSGKLGQAYNNDAELYVNKKEQLQRIERFASIDCHDFSVCLKNIRLYSGENSALYMDHKNIYLPKSED